MILLLGWHFLSAAEVPLQTIYYEASYMGVPLLNMTLTWLEDDTSIYISYDNQLKPFIAYFHPIHNIYKVQFKRSTYSPLTWSKLIAEGDMYFELKATRVANGVEVNYSTGETLAFPANGFTVFSATHFLAEKAKDADFFPVTLPVFIDGEIWEAVARRYDARHPHPDQHIGDGLILVQADLHYLSGESLVENNDILTSVIATEGTRFLLWVNEAGQYTKAQFGKFPKAVVLEQIH